MVIRRTIAPTFFTFEMSLQTFHPSCTTAFNFHIRTIFTSCSLNPSITISYWDKMIPFFASIYAQLATRYVGIVPAYLLSCISIRALEVTIRNNRTCAKRKCVEQKVKNLIPSGDLNVTGVYLRSYSDIGLILLHDP